MFSEGELKDMEGLKRESDFIEDKYGCTSKKYGNTIGRLRVLTNGPFLISSECTSACDEEKLTAYDFEKHSGKEGTGKWKSHIWVVMYNNKVPLWRTVLKYYKHASNGANELNCLRAKHLFHCDEFIRCTRRKKERRFRLQTDDERRTYHDTLNARRWRCANWPYEKITCKDDEERASRKSCRGCPQSPTCKCCTSCVCFGCLKCRFLDCKCRTCVDLSKIPSLEP
ncbi:protein ULTRAPETALA 1-like [Hibiscus syriacus]|uniref:protein ULTRAPETALA 1-like n=1 Tax=Hibiscus syriacus TaxID=106335 RepID=UPI001921D365|nr:protein ULTRAPETALA 1-like [Hibiscus syriacus]